MGWNWHEGSQHDIWQLYNYFSLMYFGILISVPMGKGGC